MTRQMPFGPLPASFMLHCAIGYSCAGPPLEADQFFDARERAVSIQVPIVPSSSVEIRSHFVDEKLPLVCSQAIPLASAQYRQVMGDVCQTPILSLVEQLIRKIMEWLGDVVVKCHQNPYFPGLLSVVSTVPSACSCVAAACINNLIRVRPHSHSYSTGPSSSCAATTGFLHADAEPFLSGIGSSMFLALSRKNTFFMLFSLLIPVISLATVFVISS